MKLEVDLSPTVEQQLSEVASKVWAERLSKRGVIYQTTLKLPEKAF